MTAALLETFTMIVYQSLDKKRKKSKLYSQKRFRPGAIAPKFYTTTYEQSRKNILITLGGEGGSKVERD